MKTNTFVRFYHRDTYYYIIISHNTSVSPYDWPFGIGYWNAYVTCIMGVSYKSIEVSRHEVRFFSDASEQTWI